MELAKVLMVGYVDFARYCRGFHAKQVDAAGFEWSYIKREARIHDAETVIFLHGFSSTKEAWVNLASHTSRKRHIVIPDLPGQGRTTPAEASIDYSAPVQAARLREFIANTIGVDRKIHLVGHSMGGFIAGMYAALYGENVCSLTLICPAGLSMPKSSYALQLLEDTGKNLLLARTPDELLELIQYIEYEPMYIPRFVASLTAMYRKKQYPVFTKVLNDIIAQRTMLDNYLHQITCKTMVLWGKNDHILDPSSVQLTQERLVNAEEKFFFVFDECGHILQQEKYEECLMAVNGFLDGETPVVYVKVPEKPAASRVLAPRPRVLSTAVGRH